MVWTAPVQLIICLILLIINLGPSALAGFAFFILATPAQTLVMKNMFKLRSKCMTWTDKRAKLLQELLGGMKVIKFFAWEIPFLERISGFRQKEMAYVAYPCESVPSADKFCAATCALFSFSGRLIVLLRCPCPQLRLFFPLLPTPWRDTA
jgi:hypothetical protein